MSQTFYIDNDEEIISVIGRLRKSSEVENTFVFPKRALVLQSIVNLRLFQREAQKMGKKITLVTQDEIGRMLAEKAGIPTETYSDDFSQKQNHLELSHTPQVPATPAGMPGPEPAKPAVVRSGNIGSSDFFAGGQAAATAAAPLPPEAPQGQKLRIRDASPQRPPSLNSERYRESLKPAEPPRPQPMVSPSYAPMPAPPIPPQPAYQPSPAAEPRENREDALKRFFMQDAPGSGSAAPSRPPTYQAPPAAPKKSPSPVVHQKAHTAFYIFGIISVLSVLGVMAYLFFPKVTVRITPLATTDTVDLHLVGISSGSVEAEDRVPVRFVERDMNVTVTEKASGTSGSSNQKARGTIVIYNDFSKESQALVATTRFETADGKIFRLVDSVTVPGQTGTPGAIEASVIADQAGESYNIDPADFTIPGFKGSAKFDKFTAKSVKKMSGGGNAGSELLTIAKADLEKAENSARAQAEEAFFAELKPTLTGTEAFLRESMEITPAEGGNTPQVGSAAETFEYTKTYKVRGFIVSEEALKEKARAAAPKQVNGIALEATDIRTDFGEISADFEKKEVAMRVHADVSQMAAIDKTALTGKLLGQDTAGVEAVLKEHPEIQKIELIFKPDWFGASIPKSPSRVMLEIVPEKSAAE